jgi:hypothetical protein
MAEPVDAWAVQHEPEKDRRNQLLVFLHLSTRTMIPHDYHYDMVLIEQRRRDPGTARILKLLKPLGVTLP